MKTKQETSGKVEILIVEESRTQAEQLGFLLEQHGYQVTIAADGKLALAAAQAQKPALVISDILMPEMDGYQLCKAIKTDETLKDIPVILETAVGRARVGRHGVGWQGETTRQAPACKEEQRRQHAPGRLNRVRSALAHWVSWFVGTKISIHAACPAIASDQLRFLGSSW